jgi:hypothetical protein
MQLFEAAPADLGYSNIFQQKAREGSVFLVIG